MELAYDVKLMMRLAYISPLPPTPSGIADYSSELLPQLAKRAEITLYVDDHASVDDALTKRYTVAPLENFAAKRGQHDIAIYHMGNNAYHEAIYRYLLRFPGVVVLHDLYINHLISYMTYVRGDLGSYAGELGYVLGIEGLNLYRKIRLGRQRYPTFEMPLCNRLVDRSLGVMVHSRMAAAAIQAMRPERPVRVIPAVIAEHDGKSLRMDMGVSEATTVFASLGFINETKQIDLALRVFARLREEMPDVHYILAGGIQGDYDLVGLISELGLEGAVTCTGYIEELKGFLDWIETADIVINLRNPTLGETSAAALRAMAAEKPIIVFDHGWYGELPEDICLKVPPIDEERLFLAMRALAADSERRSKMGLAGAKYARQSHSPEIVAEATIDFLESCLTGIRHRLLGN